MEATQEKAPAQAAAAAAAFEPRLTAFFCKWCTYAGADLAGTSRLTYPPNVRALMLPCTGRIDIVFVLRAFLQGADGVLVSGCHPGDCHYTAGNYRARRRWLLFRDLLDTLGFDLCRFECAWISAAEGQKFAKTITAFTERLAALGPYREMREVAAEHLAPAASRAVPVSSPVPEPPKLEPLPALTAAVTEALRSGKVKAVVGWTRNQTLRLPRLTWAAKPEEAAAFIAPGLATGNLARALKNPSLHGVEPLGMVVRPAELRALNVLCQEKHIASDKLVLFAFDAGGKYLGPLDWNAAQQALLPKSDGQVAGFAPEILKQLDELMAKPPAERWAFWRGQFERCLKCYACRQTCPLCNCEQCLADKNQPQWFPTAADGPGNLAWHIVRAFHFAGRCIGCGACQDACPAGLPINVLGAGLARSALKHFGHVAGADPAGVPLQADYKPDDKESFIL